MKKLFKGLINVSLRARLTVLVSVELIASVLIALGVDWLLRTYGPQGWAIPEAVELLAITLFIGILVTSLLSKLFFDPIKKLGSAMEQVANGDFSVRMPEKVYSREIRDIYRGFNLMNRELGNTEILKTDFVSNVSHEIKTPINAIEGYATLLQGCEGLSAQEREYVDKIVFNTKRLSTLTASILLLSKIENQNIPTNQKRFALDEQIRQSLVSMEDAWVSKNIELDVELDRVGYYGSDNLMHHVWDNLISNAVKFSPIDGKVTIRLKKRGEEVVFYVQDQGPGISKEAQRHIFDKFYQADSSHKEEGNGLGLALVKKILSLEEGSICVENCAEHGCRFTVILKDKIEVS